MHHRKNLVIFGKEITIGIENSDKNVHIGSFSGKSAIAVSFDPVGAEFTGKVCAVIARGEEEISVAVPTEQYGKDICYECNLLHELGGLVKPGDIFYTKFEKTGGAVMFTEKDGERRYLLIKNESGHIGFPKGHIEYGETDTDTAKREVFEETGLDFIQYGEFCEEYTYNTKENCVKTGVFFIGHYDYREPTIQEEEILDDWLLPYGKAMELLNFPEDRELLTHAEEYISKKE